MAWIDTISYEDATGKLKQLYDRVKGPEVVSDESELVSVCHTFGNLGGKLPPFGECVFPAFLEPVSIFDLAF